MAEKECQPEEVSDKHSTEVPSHILPGIRTGEIISGKSTWPEVVGLSGEEAKIKIEEEMPNGSQIYVVPSGSFVTMDLRSDRVRIFIDSSGKVSYPPRIA
ncbi:hypothetical protein ACJIZ3_024085 [Penstemon smallii]|uniref:Uncharacterized protein n=1 Tax=Penstemon smallii TaxID=265156 RepID=A0ABD3TQU9_9LAMI